MKLSVTTTTLALAILSSVAAAPTATTTTTDLTKRETDHLEMSIARINSFASKRHTMSIEEIAKRENQIVTDVLTAIKNTNLAPGIITYFIDDPTLSSIATNVIVAALKSGIVNLDTLLKALNDSGLAVQVIQDVISNCQFYATVYKVALKFIGNLLLGGGGSTTSAVAKREDLLPAKREIQRQQYKREDLLTSLMESLKSSGLASQVVNALVTDEQFYTWGADLIQQLFEQDAITIPELISDLADSGLIPSLFEAFFNLQTLNTVIANALNAFLGKCGTDLPSSTPSGPVTCKRKRRRRAVAY